MSIYGGNMKKQKIFLKNKQLLGFYLVVGVLFSVISVVAPSISGELVNAVIYRQGDVKVYLFLLVLTYILLLLFSIADQYFFQYFQIKEKNAMRNELFQASLKRGNQEKEQIAAFTSFVNNDVPNIVENYYGGTVDIIKCVCIIVCNGVQREHNKKLNNGLPILHKVPPKRDYGRYFCIMAEKGGTSHGGLTEKLSLFFHAKKQEVNAYGR
jgi:ABC-type multidrug transport system fused ATPase/permease subunit